MSGGHFNPVVTLADRFFGGVTNRQVAVYLPAQLAGGVVGAVVANLMFDLPAVSVSTTDRSGGGLWLSEAVATFGLVVLIFALVRAGRAALAPFAVGAYITAAYWWSSSTSFANPMIDLARTLSDTFAGIAPSSVPMFLLTQLVGGAAGVAVVAVLYPTRRGGRRRRRRPEGDPVTTPSVLFVCVHNAGRSQMAAGWLRHLAGDAVEVRSAGSLPGDQVNPAAVEAMAEVGIDISDQRPKVLTTDAVEASDVVITMGCGDACPVFPGKRYLDWALEDPAGKGVEAVRPIRDEIETRVRGLLAELLPLSDQSAAEHEQVRERQPAHVHGPEPDVVARPAGRRR